jgi:outer membrane receptor protein involved in Fe transport
LGVVWKASRDIAVRAAVGGGYALPPLSYLVGTNFISCSGIAYCTQTLTNINLTPEKSFGFDLGTDMRFKQDTVLSLDVYRTNLYGQFFTSFNLTGTFTGLPLYTSTVNNLAQSRFEGINFDIRHDVPHGIYWHGALGLTRAYVVSVPAGFYNKPTCTYCKNTYVVPGINFDGVSAAGGATLPAVPYTTAVLQFGYRWAPGKYIDLSPTYYGNDNPYYEPAFVEFDAHAGYALTRDVSLMATFRNITGIYGQSYTLFTPSLGAPSAAGEPYALTGLPYGPRSLIVTAIFK